MLGMQWGTRNHNCLVSLGSNQVLRKMESVGTLAITRLLTSYLVTGLIPQVPPFGIEIGDNHSITTLQKASTKQKFYTNSEHQDKPWDIGASLFSHKPFTNPLFLSIQQPLSRGLYYQNTVVLIGCFWKLDIGAHQTLLFQNLTDNLFQTILLTIYILIIVTHICSTHVLISMVSPVPFQECTEDHTQWLRWRAGSDWHCVSQRPPQRIWRLLSEIEAPKNCIKKNRSVPIAPYLPTYSPGFPISSGWNHHFSRSAKKTRRPALAPAQPSAPKPRGIRQKSGVDQQRCWLNHWNTHG